MMDASTKPTLWYGLTGIAFVEWVPLAALSAFWLVAVMVQSINGNSPGSGDWRMPYLFVVCTAAVLFAGVMFLRFRHRERGAKRVAGPALAVVLGMVFIGMLAIVGD
jgi:hypothetical protein